MLANKIITFKFILILALNLDCTFSNRAIIISSITQIPCTKLNSSPPLMTGVQIFSAAKVQTSSVQEIMISMWFKPQSFQTSDNPLFSIYTNSPITNLLSVQYKYPSYEIYGVLNGVYTSIISISQNYWSFVRVLAKLSPTPGGDDSLFVQLSYNGSELSSNLLTQASLSGSAFTKSNLLFNFGYSSSAIPDEPSCSSIDYVVVQFNFDSSEWTDIDKFRQSQSIDSSLIIHYDLFYSKKNPNYLLSFGTVLNRLIQTGLQDNIDEVVLMYPNEINIQLQYLESHGFIFSFECKASNQSVYVRFGYQFALGIESSTLCYFLGSGSFPIRSITIGEWYQFVLIFQKIDTSTFLVKIYDGVQFQFINLYLQFFNLITISPQIDSSSLDNIRLFQGTRIQETLSCLVQAEGESQKCVICKPGFYLSYEQNQQCLPSIPAGNISSRVPNIIDWVRTDCPLNMMHSVITSKCHCPFQTYEENGACKVCPSYCRGCHSPTDCIQFDTNRAISTGKCLNNLFDDGYNCLKRSFFIPNRKNYYYDVNGAGVIILSNPELGLTGTDPFFFTLQLYVNSGAQKNKVAEFITANSQLFEVFVEDNVKICFYYLSGELKCFSVLSYILITFAMWVSKTEVIIAINFNQIKQFDIISLSPVMASYSSPTLCLGDCDNEIQNGNLRVSFYIIKYYQGMTKPLDFKKDAQQLMYIQSNLIYHFQLFVPNKNTSQITPIFGQSSQYFVRLQRDDITTNYFKGLSGSFILFMNQCNDGSRNFQNIYTISLSLFIKNLSEIYQLVQYSSSNYYQRIHLIPQNFGYEMIISVQIHKESKQTKTCFVKINEPTFLAFIWNEISASSSTFEVILVSNFCRETLQFHQPYIEKDNYLNLYSSNNHENYINNIRGFSGSEFYFDYTESDPCFLYYGLNDMKCIKAKEGYAIYENQAIPKDDCSKIIGATKYLYNQFTGECSENPIKFDCAEVNQDDLSCISCNDINADPLHFCFCKTGYYQNQNTLICEKCLGKCESCSDISSCLTCKSLDALAPDCDCIDQHSYQTSDYQCEPCSPQCATCETNADNCKQCAADRIDIPNCECNPAYFDQSKSTNYICLEIECQSQCESCEYSSKLCIYCGKNRTNPPTCDCEENYVEVEGECIKCPHHYYYSKQQKECLECNFRCLECYQTSTQCTECHSSLYLYQSQCLCSDLSEFILRDDGEIECASFMSVNLSAQVISDINCLIFTFEYDIEQLTYSELGVDEFLYIYFNQISSQDFKITQARSSGNQLIIEFRFYKSYPYLTGSVTFLKTNIFTNLEFKKVLDLKYKIENLKFQFDSIVFQQDTYSSLESLTNVSIGIKDKIGENNSPTGILRQISVLYYIINTLQPCAIFLMVDIPLPPNLYQFLHITGLLLFKKVPDYGQKDDSEVQIDFFTRLGLSGPSLVSMPAVFIQFGIWSSIFLFTLFSTYLLGVHHKKQYKLLHQIKDFVILRLIACMEGSILLLVVLSTLQVMNINEKQYFSRMSLYVALYTFFIVGLVYYKVYLIHSKKKLNEQVSLTSKYKKGKIPLFYLNSQLCKKIIMAILIVLLVDFPQLLCFLFVYIMLMSLIETVIIRPYKVVLNNMIKILGELCQLIVWIIYAFIFAPFVHSSQNLQSVIPDEQMSQFLLCGYICMVCLLIFNAIFVFEFCYTLSTNTYQWCKNRKIQKDNDGLYRMKKRNQLSLLNSPLEINLSNSSKQMITTQFNIKNELNNPWNARSQLNKKSVIPQFINF